MESDLAAPRSRRALLAAAAAAGGALVASAALPMSALAHDVDDVQKGVDNPTTATTSITNSTVDNAAFAAHGAGTGTGAGVLGTSAGGNGVAGTSDSGTGVLGQSTSGSGVSGSSSSDSGVVGTSTDSAGVFAWGVSAPDWINSTEATHTGVFGFSPAGDGVTTSGTGVWGDSEDYGVFGSGTYGVTGFGAIGVLGNANDLAGSIGVWAWAPPTTQTALRVDGKVHFSRSGRVAMLSGKSSKAVTLAGTTSTSKVFAVLATSESGRYVRAVVPASGKFTIYLNTTLTSSAVVSWFVLD